MGQKPDERFIPKPGSRERFTKGFFGEMLCPLVKVTGIFGGDWGLCQPYRLAGETAS